MMQIAQAKPRSKGSWRKSAALLGIGAGLFATGHYIGARQPGQESQHRQLEEIARLPPAKGFLSYPDAYRIETRINRHGEREAYLQDLGHGVELPLPQATWRLLSAYAGGGSYAMESAMRTVELSRKAYSALGGVAEGPKPYAVKR